MTVHKAQNFICFSAAMLRRRQVLGTVWVHFWGNLSCLIQILYQLGQKSFYSLIFLSIREMILNENKSIFKNILDVRFRPFAKPAQM